MSITTKQRKEINILAKKLEDKGLSFGEIQKILQKKKNSFSSVSPLKHGEQPDHPMGAITEKYHTEWHDNNKDENEEVEQSNNYSPIENFLSGETDFQTYVTESKEIQDKGLLPVLSDGKKSWLKELDYQDGAWNNQIESIEETTKTENTSWSSYNNYVDDEQEKGVSYSRVESDVWAYPKWFKNGTILKEDEVPDWVFSQIDADNSQINHISKKTIQESNPNEKDMIKLLEKHYPFEKHGIFFTRSMDGTNTVKMTVHDPNIPEDQRIKGAQLLFPDKEIKLNNWFNSGIADWDKIHSEITEYIEANTKSTPSSSAKTRKKEEEKKKIEDKQIGLLNAETILPENQQTYNNLLNKKKSLEDGGGSIVTAEYANVLNQIERIENQEPVEVDSEKVRKHKIFNRRNKSIEDAKKELIDNGYNWNPDGPIQDGMAQLVDPSKNKLDDQRVKELMETIWGEDRNIEGEYYSEYEFNDNVRRHDIIEKGWEAFKTFNSSGMSNTSRWLENSIDLNETVDFEEFDEAIKNELINMLSMKDWGRIAEGVMDYKESNAFLKEAKTRVLQKWQVEKEDDFKRLNGLGEELEIDVINLQNEGEDLRQQGKDYEEKITPYINKLKTQEKTLNNLQTEIEEANNKIKEINANEFSNDEVKAQHNIWVNISQSKAKQYESIYNDYLKTTNQYQKIYNSNSTLREQYDLFEEKRNSLIKDNEAYTADRKTLFDQVNDINSVLNYNIIEGVFENDFKSTDAYEEWKQKNIREGNTWSDAANTFFGEMGKELIDLSVGFGVWLGSGVSKPLKAIFGYDDPWNKSEFYTNADYMLDLYKSRAKGDWFRVGDDKKGTWERMVDHGMIHPKSVAEMLPFTLMIINSAKKGNVSKLKDTWGLRTLSPKRREWIRRGMNMSDVTMRMLVMDNLYEAQDMGLTGNAAHAYSFIASGVTALSQMIMPDYKWTGGATNKLISNALANGLRGTVNKATMKTLALNTFNRVTREFLEEEIDQGFNDLAKISFNLDQYTVMQDEMTHKDILAGVLSLSGSLAPLSIRGDYLAVRNKIYEGVKLQGEDIISSLNTQLDYVNDQITKLSNRKNYNEEGRRSKVLNKMKTQLEDAVIFTRSVQHAVNSSPGDVNGEQIDLILRKQKLIEKKKTVDKSFYGEIDSEIESIDQTILKDRAYQQYLQAYQDDVQGTKERSKEIFGNTIEVIETNTQEGSAEQIETSVNEQIIAIDEQLKTVEKGTKEHQDLSNYKAELQNEINNITNLKQSPDQESLAVDGFKAYGYLTPPDVAGNSKMIINKKAALMGGFVTTGQHEFLHAVLRETIGNDPALQRGLGGALMDALNDGSIEYEGGTEFGQRLAAYQSSQAWEETMPLFSEALSRKDVNLTSSIINKLKNTFRQWQQRNGKKDIELNDGNDIINFIRDYNQTMKSGKKDIALTKAAQQGIRGKIIDGARAKGMPRIVQSKPANVQTESGAEFEQRIGDLYEGFENSLKGKFQYVDGQQRNFVGEIVGAYKPRVEKVLRSEWAWTENNKQKFDAIVQDVLTGPRGIESLIFKYDKRVPLSGYIGSILKKRTMQEFVEKEYPEGIIEQAITEESKQIEDVDAMTIDEQFDEVAMAELPFRKSLTINGEEIITEDIIERIKDAVVKTFGTRLPDVNSKEFKSALEEAFMTELEPIIKQAMGTRVEYEQFLKENYKDLLNFIPKEKWVAIERNTPREDRIFTEVEIENMNPTQTDKAISEGRIPKNTSRDAGNTLWKFKKPQQIEFLNFYVNKKLGSKKGTRKDRLASLIAAELGFDMTMQVVEDPAIKEKRRGLAEITGQEYLENETAIIAKQIERPIGFKFSKQASHQKFGSLKRRGYTESKLIEDVTRLSQSIQEAKDLDHVLSEDGILLPEYVSKIPDVVVEFVFDKLQQGELMDGSNIRYKQAVFANENISQETRDNFKNDGAIRNNEKALNRLQEDSEILALELGPEIMNLLGYDVLGYVSRVMDSAARKEDPNWRKGMDPKLKYLPGVTGPYYNKLVRLKNKVNKAKVKLPKGLVLEDVALMNKKFPLFNDVTKILEQDVSKEIKLEQLKELEPAIRRANEANILLAKHIAKTIGESPISELSKLHLMQIQTNIVSGFRALSGLDLITVLDGSQKPSEDHPMFNEIYEKIKGDFNTFEERKKAAISLLRWKGEHMAPNSNTMNEIVDLWFRKIKNPSIDMDKELDNILDGHTQWITSFNLTKVIDTKGGETNDTNLHRIKFLNSKEQNNVYGIGGESYSDVLLRDEINKTFRFSKPEMAENTNDMNILAKAIRFSRSSKNPKRGISIWDFDDTLARTKSGVRYTLPNPSGETQPGRKVIFLAGGAGSGKSNVVKKLGLVEQGFKLVNSDISLEWLKKNSGLPENMNDLTAKDLSLLGKLQWEARKIAHRKKMKFQGRGDGVIIDGTGGSLKVMQDQVKEFQNAGYDVQMLFVETSMSVALERNQKRKERSLLDKIVIKNHEKVQGNKEAFKGLFGNNFAEINTDKLTLDSPMPKRLINKLDKFTKGYIKGRLSAEEFAAQGSNILDKGGEFDFSEFNKVVKGEKGPLFGKAMARAKKFGTKDQFILTARPKASAKAIHEFLKSQGLEIPLSNITGLANSTSEAKALWVAEKVGEGYNDIYFADDHMENVQAVKNMLDQFDVKSKVQQAKIQFSKEASDKFNEIIQETKGVGAKKTYSRVVAQKMGEGIGKWKWFVPPSADDFKGLLDYFITSGKEGDAQREWLYNALIKPFSRATREINSAKQSITDDYKALRKEMPEIRKTLGKIIPGTKFTYDSAIRAYLWTKSGFDIPGISKRDANTLINTVQANPALKEFARRLGLLSRQEDGYVKPKEYWAVESIASDLDNVTNQIGRKQFLQEWIENKNEIFSEQNLNKIEAIYGSRYREALEDMLYRMENGTNRPTGTNRLTNSFMNWVNNSVGAIMFFNARSAVLQTLSTVNFINWNDNNIFKAGLAFANQPQYWKDFATLFNSDMLKQRRRGLKTDVNASEIAQYVANSSNKPLAALNWLLQKGFLPTQIADSFAIASGGATFYRNRTKTYMKQGLTQEQAEIKAFEDFQNLAEETQQSSRPDMISQQQASPLGRLILAFQNTPMQYVRLMKKAAGDLIKGRGDWKANISRIIYYGAVQNLIFASLQSALFALMFTDDEEDEEILDKKSSRVINTMADSILRGSGIFGAAISTVKNIILEFHEQEQKKWGADHAYTLIEAVNLSPPVGSKVRKLYSAIQSYRFNKDVIPKMDMNINNPVYEVIGNVVSATTNVPLDRVVNKTNNIREALNQDNAAWQRVALALGWNRWDLGVEDEEKTQAKKEVKKEKKKKKIKKAKVDYGTTVEENKEEAKKEEKKEVKEVKEKKCNAITSSGKPCKNKAVNNGKCWAHTEGDTDRDGDGIMEVQCVAFTKSGRRCRNKTENTNKRCYAHQ